MSDVSKVIYALARSKMEKTILYPFYSAGSTFGQESRFGTPFTYLLRDMLQVELSSDVCLIE